MKQSEGKADFSIIRLHSLGTHLLTYVRSNSSSIIDYGKRHRAGLRVATTLAESVVNSLVAKRMVKKQKMRWSLHGAHMLMQVRAAELDGELRNRLRIPFRLPEPNAPPIFKPKPPLLRAACEPPQGNYRSPSECRLFNLTTFCVYARRIVTFLFRLSVECNVDEA